MCPARLLLRPRPKVGESPQGYLSRLAEANCCSAMALQQLGISFGLESLKSAGCVGPDAEDSQLLDYLQHVDELDRDYPSLSNRSTARYCPRCLREDLFFRLEWGLYFMETCTRHGAWLLDQCPQCESILDWRRRDMMRCSCGFSLDHPNTEQADEKVIGLNKIMGEKLNRSTLQSGPVHVRNLTLVQTQRLIRFLGAYSDPTSPSRPQKIARLGLMSVSVNYTMRAAGILMDWPEGLFRMLHGIQRGENADEGRLSQRFGFLYWYLYRGLGEPEFGSIREGFEDYIIDHWTGALGRRNRRLAERVLAKAAWIPANKAREKMGVSERRLFRMVQDGIVTGRVRESEKGRTFLVVKRADVERLAENLRNELSLTEAGARLGLCKGRMRGMFRFLFPGSQQTGARGAPWAIPAQAVDPISAVVGALPSVAAPLEGQVSLAHVLRYWTWSDEILANLLKAAAKGEITPIFVQDGLVGVTAWIFCEASLRRWKADQLDGSGRYFSIPAVAEMMGIKQEVAYFLVRKGLLKTIAETVPRKTAFVEPDALEAFQKTFVLASELAKDQGTSPKCMIAHLADSGIPPETGPGIDGGRQVIFRRTEVLAAAVANFVRGSRSLVRKQSPSAAA